MAALIISCVNVFLIFFAVGYIGSGMISNFIGKRKARIAESIESAKSHKEQALLTKAEYEEKIADFETERQQILGKAQKKADSVEAGILKDAHDEAERIIKRANKEAELKKAKVRDEVKTDMISVASSLAEKLIRENVDDDKQAFWIDKTLEEMGETTWQN